MGELRKFSRNFASGFTNVELVLLRQYSGGMPGIANYCSTFSSVLPRTRYISTFAVNRQGIMAVDRPSIRAIPISLPNSKFHFSLHFSVRASPNSDNFSFFFFCPKISFDRFHRDEKASFHLLSLQDYSTTYVVIIGTRCFTLWIIPSRLVTFNYHE